MPDLPGMPGQAPVQEQPPAPQWPVDPATGQPQWAPPGEVA
jgi:hypothetical protein